MNELRQLIENAYNTRRGAHCYEYAYKNGVKAKSFSELRRNALSAASFISASGLSGCRIAVALPASFGRLAAFFGIASAGCTGVILSDKDDIKRKLSLINASGARALFFPCTDTDLFYAVRESVPGIELFVSFGAQSVEGCPRFEDIVSADCGEFPDVGSNDCCAVFYPYGSDIPVEFAPREFIELGQTLPVTENGKKLLNLLPFSVPLGAAVSAVCAVSSFSALYEAEDNTENALGIFRPDFAVASGTDCVGLFSGAFSFAREMCGQRSVESSVKKYFGGNLKTLFYSGGELPERRNANYRSADVTPEAIDPLIKRNGLLKNVSAACLPAEDLSPRPAGPADGYEKTVLEAVKAVPGMESPDLNDNILNYISDPARIADLALRLRLLPQSVYDSPFLFALADKLKNENFIIAPPSGRVEALLKNPAVEKTAADKGAVFLTGASGFLGAHILRELISAGKKVFCLVRDRDGLYESYKYYFGVKPKYVKTVEGDVCKKYFGMSATQARKFSGVIGAVIHAAAFCGDCGPYGEFDQVNVKGTENALEFASITGAAFEYISDLRVFGSGYVAQQSDGAFADEKNLFIGQKYYQSPYVQSKFEAEQRVILARDRGIKTNIFRLGELFPRASDGRDRKVLYGNSPAEYIRAVAETGAYCGFTDRFPFCVKPVDEAAREVTRLVLSGETGRVFHLPGNSSLRLSEILSLAQTGAERVSDGGFFELLKKRNADPAANHVFRSFYYRAQAGRVNALDTETKKLFPELVEQRFVPDGKYFKKILSGVRPDKIEYPDPTDADVFSPEAMTEIRENLRVRPRAIILRSGKGAFAGLKELLSDLKMPYPVIITDLCGGSPEYEKLSSASEKTGLSLVSAGKEAAAEKIWQALSENNAGSIIAAGSSELIYAVKEIRGRLPFVAVPLPFGTGEETSYTFYPDGIGRFSDIRNIPELAPDCVICDPGLSCGADGIRQLVRVISGAVEAFISPASGEFKEDVYYAPGCVKTVLGLAEKTAGGNLTQQDISALQRAALDSGISRRRVGLGYAGAFAAAAYTLYGLDFTGTVFAAAPAVFDSILPLCADRLSELGEKCGFGGGAELPEALHSFFELAGAGKKIKAPEGFDKSVFAITVSDIMRKYVPPRVIPTSELEDITGRIFSDN